MQLKPALGFLFAFLGLIFLSYIGLQVFLGDLAADTTTFALGGLATAALIGGGAVVAMNEMRSA